MEQMEQMDDTEIQEKVESLVGKGTKVIDCEKSTSFQTQEVLLVNGFPVPLNGEEGARIKKALMEGQVPPGDLLNEILIRAGILKAPVELETTMNVKSTTKTTELLTLRDKHGILVDERMKEVEEDNEVNSMSTEVWKKEDKKNEEELRRLGKRVERINLKTRHQHNQQHQRQHQHHHGPPSTPPPPPPSNPPPDDDDDDQEPSAPSPSLNMGAGDPVGPGGDSTITSGLNHSSSSTSSSSTTSFPSHQTNHLNSNNNNSIGSNFESGRRTTLTKKPTTLESSSFVTPFAKFVHGCMSSSSSPSSGAEVGSLSSSSPAIIQDDNNVSSSHLINHHHHHSPEILTSHASYIGRKYRYPNNNNKNDDNNDTTNTMSVVPQIHSLSSNKNFEFTYLDPSTTLFSAEFNGVPVRVTYETFV